MLPVERSSMTMTSSPRSRYASERCDPIKPAPPVINTRKLLKFPSQLKFQVPGSRFQVSSSRSDALRSGIRRRRVAFNLELGTWNLKLCSLRQFPVKVHDIAEQAVFGIVLLDE